MSSEPTTEPIDTGRMHQKEQAKPPAPPREMSQAAVAAFFYGTLQLLCTLIGSGFILILGQLAASVKSSDLAGLAGTEGTDTADLAEMQKMIEELSAADPSLIPAPTPPTVLPDISTVPITPSAPALPNIPGFSMEATPDAIVTQEFFLIFLTQGFAILGILTACIAFEAASKGKSGVGLAVTGLISSALSIFIATIVAMAV
jgi:hypothetical protein